MRDSLLSDLGLDCSRLGQHGIGQIKPDSQQKEDKKKGDRGSLCSPQFHGLKETSDGGVQEGGVASSQGIAPHQYDTVYQIQFIISAHMISCAAV